jgi:hypothetical protein
VFGPECQHELAAGIPGSQLVIIDGAGHNPQDEQTGEVIGVLRTFLAGRQRLLEMVWRQVSAATLTRSGCGDLGGRIAMARIAGEVTIDAPVDEVFDMVADERNELRYNPRIVRAEKVSGRPVGRGGPLRRRAQEHGRQGRDDPGDLGVRQAAPSPQPRALVVHAGRRHLDVRGGRWRDAAEVVLGHGPGRLDAGAVSGAGRHRPWLRASELGWPEGVHGIRPPLSLGFGAKGEAGGPAERAGLVGVELDRQPVSEM